MARIEGVPKERASWFARLAYAFTRRKMGRVPGPLRVMAHHGGVLGGVAAFETAIERWTAVDAPLKTLASIRAATLIGCPF